MLRERQWDGEGKRKMWCPNHYVCCRLKYLRAGKDLFDSHLTTAICWPASRPSLQALTSFPNDFPIFFPAPHPIAMCTRITDWPAKSLWWTHHDFVSLVAVKETFHSVVALVVQVVSWHFPVDFVAVVVLDWVSIQRNPCDCRRLDATNRPDGRWSKHGDCCVRMHVCLLTRCCSDGGFSLTTTSVSLAAHATSLCNRQLHSSDLVMSFLATWFDSNIATDRHPVM